MFRGRARAGTTRSLFPVASLSLSLLLWSSVGRTIDRASAFGTATSTRTHHHHHHRRPSTRGRAPTTNRARRDDDDDDDEDVVGRRTLLLRASSSLLVAACSSSPASAATDPLFRPNPLTNKALEQLRVWDQDYADNVKYGGELAPGSPKGRDAYAQLLVPILAIQADVERVHQLTSSSSSSSPDAAALRECLRLLERPRFDKTNFKKIFNAFADNIYYSDPDRANAYLAGGATPKNEQTLAYLLRNDMLTNLEALRAEVEYLLRADGEDAADLRDYVANTRSAMNKYLELVPPPELRLGQDLFAAQSSSSRT